MSYDSHQYIACWYVTPGHSYPTVTRIRLLPQRVTPVRHAALLAIFLMPQSVAHGLTRAILRMIAEGKPAPDFTVQTDEGKSVSLKDYRGHWVVLYFYPKADTPG